MKIADVSMELAASILRAINFTSLLWRRKQYFVNFYQTTRRLNPKDSVRHSYRGKDPTSDSSKLSLQRWWQAESSCSLWPAVSMRLPYWWYPPSGYRDISPHFTTADNFSFSKLFSPLLQRRNIPPIKISQMRKTNIFTNS